MKKVFIFSFFVFSFMACKNNTPKENTSSNQHDQPAKTEHQNDAPTKTGETKESIPPKKLAHIQDFYQSLTKADLESSLEDDFKYDLVQNNGKWFVEQKGNKVPVTVDEKNEYLAMKLDMGGGGSTYELNAALFNKKDGERILGLSRGFTGVGESTASKADFLVQTPNGFKSVFGDIFETDIIDAFFPNPADAPVPFEFHIELPRQGTTIKVYGWDSKKGERMPKPISFGWDAEKGKFKKI